MILAVDIGNTHIEIGLYRQKTFLHSWRITTGVYRTEDELMTFIQHFLQMKKLNINNIKDIAIASVVPNITQTFMRMSEKYFQKTPFVVDHSVDLGIEIDYNPPQSVGADRICNAVAAYRLASGPVVVVDFGTATTFDIINEAGVYLGGVIAPGLETASWGLYERASKLPKISFEFPDSVIGKSTDHSMKSGIMYGSVKMIDGLIEAIARELGSSPTVIATGGLSAIVAEKSKYIERVESQLVLSGLMQIYSKNRPD